jgi:hypothetical protein
VCSVDIGSDGVVFLLKCEGRSKPFHLYSRKELVYISNEIYYNIETIGNPGAVFASTAKRCDSVPPSLLIPINRAEDDRTPNNIRPHSSSSAGVSDEEAVKNKDTPIPRANWQLFLHASQADGGYPQVLWVVMCQCMSKLRHIAPVVQ